MYGSTTLTRRMSALPIITGADTPVLRTETKRVPKVTKEVTRLVKDMEETMEKANGLGLAAPQVGSSERVCIVRFGGRVTPLINPDITWKSEETAVAEEGCLSLPGIWLDVPRSVSITVKYWDLKGREQERRLTELDARVVQHEVDHLEGVLITDYASSNPVASKALRME